MPEPSQPPKKRASPAAARQEHRAAVRYQSGAGATYRPVAGQDKALMARVYDISCTGLALVLDHCFEPGALLFIELYSAARNIPHPVLARVRHCTARPGGYWVVGCEHVMRLTEEEVQQLLS
jgi:hypothetical protein